MHKHTYTHYIYSQLPPKTQTRSDRQICPIYLVSEISNCFICIYIYPKPNYNYYATRANYDITVILS